MNCLRVGNLKMAYPVAAGINSHTLNDENGLAVTAAVARLRHVCLRRVAQIFYYFAPVTETVTR